MSQKTKTVFHSETDNKTPSTNVGLLGFVLSPEQKEELEKRQKLLALYDTYKNQYFQFYIQNLEEENSALKHTFPNVDFYILSRMKSKHNYEEKIQKKGEALDIFGDKIIILSADGKTDEDSLIAVAYDIENFLVTYKPNITEISRKRKDYIARPKPNGYSSLHITRTVHLGDGNTFDHETQIKTFRMRETEKSGPASHSSVYKANRKFFLNNIDSPESAEYFLPKYMHFEFDRKSRTDKLVMDSFENRFRYYFGQEYEDFMRQKGTLQR